MAIGDRTKRLLWAHSGGFCQNPTCVRDLFFFFENKTITSIEELAHIIAQSEAGPRAEDATEGEDRDAYENIILLCPICHTLVDKESQGFPVATLREWKRSHTRRLQDAFQVPTYTTRHDLRREVQPLLRANKAIFDTYGPFSFDYTEPLNDRASQWSRRVVGTVLPNNRRILALLRRNEHLLKEDEKRVSEEFAVHQEAFEYNHVSGDKTSAAPLFPAGMNLILTE